VSRLTLLVCACCIALACSTNPAGRGAKPRDVERRLGEWVATSVAQELGIVGPDALVAYVEEVGAALAAHAPRQDLEYRFLVVDSGTVDAFASPSGHVFITRGLLARFNGEDELANLIGHEIGHVAARHALERAKRAAPLAAATGLPKAAEGLLLPGLGRSIGSVGQFAGSLVLAPYSPAQESEADQLGQAMAAAAGWDPRGWPAFVHTLQREAGLAGAGGSPLFLRTHPLGQDRMQRSAAHAETLEPAAPARADAGRAEFLARLDGLLVGDNPSEGSFRANAFLHPGLGLWLGFPAGWTTMNGRDFLGAQSPDRTARAILQIVAEGDDPLAAARGFAQREGAAFGLLPQGTRLGGVAGARAVGHGGGASVDVSWIAHDGLIYQITGVCRSEDYDAYQTPFIDVALSLRALRAEERAGISEQRLRIVEAHEGESLSALIARTQGRWSAEQTAAANALDAGAALRGGQRIKVPVAQRYAGREELPPSP
jgi:predicted Zn-dependent protease